MLLYLIIDLIDDIIEIIACVPRLSELKIKFLTYLFS